jgi:hypothetical protein
MSCSLFEKSLYYTYFMQCVEYKNAEQSHVLIPAIKNLVSKKLSLYKDVDLR